MGLTKGGVCYDLANTPFVLYRYGYNFYFSSMTHLEKFDRDIQKRIEWLNDSMRRRFHYNCSFDVLAVLQLYNQVETRGFRIKDFKGHVYTEPEQVLLVVGDVNE